MREKKVASRVAPTCAVVACLVWTVGDGGTGRSFVISLRTITRTTIPFPAFPREPPGLAESKTDGIARRSHPHRAHKSQ